MEQVAVARRAMATRFEIVLHGDNPVALRAAGESALEEIERLDKQLSFYRPSSEISRINAQAAHGPVRVDPELFQLLQRALALSEESGGAFDITVAPLLRCWGFSRGAGRMPDRDELAAVLHKVGAHLVILDKENYSVRFAREGVLVDLGAIGKGYAIDRAADLLLELGITSAILHGGTSTIYGIGTPPGAKAWRIAMEHPVAELSDASSRSDAGQAAILGVVDLVDSALSVSAVSGKYFELEGGRYGHVIDPRNGQPVTGAILAAVVLNSATETDALSTALLTLGPEAIEFLGEKRPDLRCLVVSRVGEGEEELRVDSHGIEA